MQAGNLVEPSETVLNEWFQWVIRNIKLPIDLIVYLRTSPKAANERVLKRNRFEELSVFQDYMEKLHTLWLLVVS